MEKTRFYISDDLANDLKKYTSTKDRADVGQVSNSSPSILRDITYQVRPVVNTNINAFYKLIDKAEQNADETINEARKFKKLIKKIKADMAATISAKA